MSHPVTFTSLNDLITFVFKHEQKSMLSLERICEVIKGPDLYLQSRSGETAECATISRRRISSALSGSEIFVRAGPPRGCMWALRPNNPCFISDGQISASIEQMLTANGPMALEQFVATTELSGVDGQLFERFLSDHSNVFSKGEDGLYWFTGHDRPVANDFGSICQALVYAFAKFTNGASVEELHWFLCVSTVGGNRVITRRNVSRELSRRTDLFMHVSRARYALIPQNARRSRSLPHNAKVPTDFGDASGFDFSVPAIPGTICPLSEDEKKEDDFDPFAFFDDNFTFQY